MEDRLLAPPSSGLPVGAAAQPPTALGLLAPRPAATHGCTAKEEAARGGIAFRDLVYVVHPIPRTMLEYIWDYGTLHDAEEVYHHRPAPCARP